MDLDLETFLTALYVIVDDVYQTHIRPQMPMWGGPSALMGDSEVRTPGGRNDLCQLEREFWAQVS